MNKWWTGVWNQWTIMTTNETQVTKTNKLEVHETESETKPTWDSYILDTVILQNIVCFISNQDISLKLETV